MELIRERFSLASGALICGANKCQHKRRSSLDRECGG
jgi:hypothetical protein